MGEPEEPADLPQEDEDAGVEENLPEPVARKLERLGPEQRAEAEALVAAVRFEMRTHRGPLPPASMLTEYNEALPGLAREIVDTANEERRHRHSMDRTLRRDEFVLNIGGLVAVIFALMMMLGIVAYMVAAGSPTAGATLGGAIIVGVVVALTNYNKSEPTKDPEPSKDAKSE